jgi:tRNA-dihydrouridine synthase A
MALSVAPMMEWTDRHYRFMARMLTEKTKFYTEMVVADDIVKKQGVHLDVLLEFSESEHPIALQLGGCDPEVLAKATETVCRNFK